MDDTNKKDIDDILKNGDFAYIPHKGIYRWNANENKYEKVFGKDFPVSGTGVIHPIPINDEILDGLGFEFKDSVYRKDDYIIDRNLTEPYYTSDGTPIKDFNDLFDKMKQNNVSVDCADLLKTLSKKKQNN